MTKQSDSLTGPRLVSEAARRLGVSSATVRSWVAQGKLHAHRTPSGMRILQADDIERFAAERGKPNEAA